MATMNPRPRGDASLQAELKKIRAELAQLRRQVTRPAPEPVLVQISREEVLSWPVGTAWLDISDEDEA